MSYPHRHTRRFVLMACLMTPLVSSLAYALPPVPVTPPLPLAPVNAYGPADVQATAAIPAVAEGVVKSLLFNPYGEADGLRLNNDVLVKFPPHLSPALVAAVQPGQTIRVLGHPEAGRTVKADAIINTSSGKIVTDQPPANGLPPLPPHLRAQQLQPLQVQGKVDLVLTGPRGETSGVILDNQSMVYFPPESLTTPLQHGADFAASGLGTRTPNGVSLEAIRIGSSPAQLHPLYENP